MWTKENMADAVIECFHEGATVNLGIGMPTMVAERLPESLKVIIHSENGVLGVGGRPKVSAVSPTLINAGKETVTLNKGGSFFDSATSFGMIRGGHVDFCVLGGMEVDADGGLANWMVPGKKITGMGGAMDLVHGARQVIIMMNHASKDGLIKLVPKCTLPLTGVKVVHKVVTELGLFAPMGSHFKILKLAPGVLQTSLGPANLFQQCECMFISIALLTLSNIFMTFAWYGHLKHVKDQALWMAILVSWGIAFFEYCLQVPGNRIGSEIFTLPQLKIIQEVITMVVFSFFAVFYMQAPLTKNYLWAGLCLVGAVYFIFKK